MRVYQFRHVGTETEFKYKFDRFQWGKLYPEAGHWSIEFCFFGIIGGLPVCKRSRLAMLIQRECHARSRNGGA